MAIPQPLLDPSRLMADAKREGLDSPARPAYDAAQQNNFGARNLLFARTGSTNDLLHPVQAELPLTDEAIHKLAQTRLLQVRRPDGELPYSISIEANETRGYVIKVFPAIEGHDEFKIGYSFHKYIPVVKNGKPALSYVGTSERRFFDVPKGKH